MVIIPPTLTPIPPFPTPADRTNYNTMAYVWATALQGQFSSDLIALGNNVYLNAGDAKANADVAYNSMVSAQGFASQAGSSAVVSLAGSNFKGLWTGLTGAMARPASVKHNNRYWMLLSDIATSPGVQTKQPGVDAAWTALDVGLYPQATISTSQMGVLGTCHNVDTPNVVLGVPPGVLFQDYFGFRNISTTTKVTLDFGTVKVNGNTPGLVTCDSSYNGADFYWLNSTIGYTTK